MAHLTSKTYTALMTSGSDVMLQAPPLPAVTITEFLFLDSAAGLWSEDEATGAATELEVLPDVAATNDIWAGSGKAWFTTIATGSPSYDGTQLWSSTGTAQGTSLVVALPDNPDDNNPFIGIATVVPLSDGKAVFDYNDGSGGYSLYLTDGTAPGTTVVTGIGGSVDLPFSGLDTEISGAFVFLSSNGFWSLNGTTGAATPIQALTVGGHFNPGAVVDNGKAFFSATAPGSNSNAGTQLWVSNGTAEGTGLVTTLPDNTPATSSYDSAGIYGIVALSNGKVLFSYCDGSSPGTNSLYLSDGTSEGTVKVSGYSGTAELSASSGDPASKLGGNYLFVDGNGLWSVNETTGVASNLASLNGAVLQPTMVVADGEVWFQAIAPGSSSEFGTQLWTSTGTALDTRLVTTLPDSPASNPINAGIRNISPLANGKVAISYIDGNNDGWLYESDGTAEGTTLVAGFGGTQLFGELPFGTAAEFNTASCFVAGTRISTERGEVAVEDLREGDRVQVVLSGRFEPVVWLGHRSVDCTRHPEPYKVWPVRIASGAFEPGRPCRDLFLSPDHAVYIGDVLIPIKHLVNGHTIAQAPCDAVSYYHVELPWHSVLLANGLAAESYLDTGDRRDFDNGGFPVALHPDFASRAREAEGCAPLIITGPELDAARYRVATRAAEMVRHDAVA